MRTKIKNRFRYNETIYDITLYRYNNRIFEGNVTNKNFNRHLKNKDAVVAFLTETAPTNYLTFKKLVDSISWEEIDNLYNEKVKEIEFNKPKQFTLWP